MTWLIIFLLFLGVAVIGPRLSSCPPVVAFYLRCAASFFCLILCASYGVVASLALRLVGYAGLSQWTVARAFKWTMYLCTGIRFVILPDGAEWLETRPAVFIGNHQTELDVLMLGTMFPKYCSVTAKKSLRWAPFLGWFMALSKTVFIDRANNASARQAFDAAAEQMRTERQSVYIFPEGTRSYPSEPRLLPFKKGAFHLAVQAGVPIVPVVVANYSDVLHVQSKRFRAGVVPIRVLEPVQTAGLAAADVEELTQSTREKMLKALVELTEEAQKKGGQAVAMDGRNAVKATGRDR